MKTKIITFIIAFGLCLGFTANNKKHIVYASPTNIQQVDDVFNKMDRIQTIIQKYDSNIEQLLLKINEDDIKLKQIQTKINNKEKEIQMLQKNIEDKQNLLNERIKVMYMNGCAANQYLSFVLSSDTLSDLMNRIHITKFLINYDKQIIKDMNLTKEKMTKVKKELEQEKSKVAKIKKDNESKMKVIEKDKAKQQRLLTQLRASQINDKSSFAPKNVLQDIHTKSNNIRLSRGGESTASNIISYSTKFLGVPYLWGGTTPKGFDCSGFVQYVYAHNGYSISRVARDQQHDGYAVSSLQPGDLLFYGNPAHHVTMYIGNGYMIEAPHTGSHVKIGPVRKYTNARRILR